MSCFVRWFFRLCFVVVLGVLSLHLFHLGSALPLRAAGWMIAIVAGVVILVAITWERLRRKKEGYYVDTLGGAEGGTVRYHEAGNILELYFDRVKDTLYIPTATTWLDIMPAWARNRRTEIVGRIQRHVGRRIFGRSWIYEETDTQGLLFNQNKQDKL